MANVNPYQAPAAAVADAGDAVQEVKVFAVAGRLGRVRYLAYGVAFYLLFAVVILLSSLLDMVGVVLVILGWLGLLVMAFMLTIQRCHDFSSSGWLSLLMLIPFVNLMFLFIPGTDGPNRFGAPTPPNTVGVLILAWVFPAIMVIGIIAAIALPAYVDYQKRAGQVQQR